MRKTILFIVVSAIFLTACGAQEDNAETDDRIQIAVTTTFLYDMVSVLEEDVDHFKLELIIPAGEDPHVYQPKASDLRKINESDFILYQGLNFEGRMIDLLETGIPVADDLDTSSLETMEEDGVAEVDPHFWFNIDLYKEAMTNVFNILTEMNPDGEAAYQDNLNAYFEELDELDDYVSDRIEEVPRESRILITPHDAFGYMATSYDIDVHAPQGFSTDSEVSNNQIQNTAALIAERDINAIFLESTTNPDRMTRLQEIVASEGVEVEIISGDNRTLLSDSLAPRGESGDTYISMYKHNIDLIVDNLK
ncbi:MAG TPA: zinc ABC transporter substrate-binding protein [Candidatus Salinicoccus merdavium]|nr:zinc ABC transporter substrate-binding protein [Candidatus Salinicoccus merdavium]